MEVGEVKLPKPVFSDILIKNPLTAELTKELTAEVEMLPEADRKEYMQKKMPILFDKVLVISVGPDCRMVKEGSEVMVDHTIALSATYILDEQYMLFSERAIKGIW